MRTIYGLILTMALCLGAWAADSTIHGLPDGATNNVAGYTLIDREVSAGVWHNLKLSLDLIRSNITAVAVNVTGTNGGYLELSDANTNRSIYATGTNGTLVASNVIAAITGNLANGTNLHGTNIQAGTINSNALDAATISLLLNQSNVVYFTAGAASQAPNSNTTYYVSPGGGAVSSTETKMYFYYPKDGLVTGFGFHRNESSTLSAGTNVVATIKTNGVDTGMTVTLSGSTYYGTDTAHPFTHYSTNPIYISFKYNAGIATEIVNWWIQGP